MKNKLTNKLPSMPASVEEALNAWAEAIKDEVDEVILNEVKYWLIQKEQADEQKGKNT